MLVEGVSDREAVESLARRYGRNLVREGISVVAIGGAQALGRHLAGLEDGARFAGLYDIGEEKTVRRALGRRAAGPIDSLADLERHGFFACEADLEDELIRALGTERVEAVLASTGKLSSFRTFQRQPHWQGRPVEAQLRRFFGSSAGKIRHARLLVEALDLERVPLPLAALLDFVGVTR